MRQKSDRPARVGSSHWKRTRKLLLAALSSAVILASPAQAGDTKVAPGMSPLDVLIVQNELHEKWVDYTLMLDGDGIRNETAEWARAMFTEDLKWRWYDAEGNLKSAANSREEMEKPRRTGNRTQSSLKHLPTIKYDEISPDTAKTRAAVMIISVARSDVPGAPDTAPGVSAPGVPQLSLIVYHDTWRKTDAGWRKSESILHSATYPKAFAPKTSCPTPDLSAPGCAP